MRNQCHTGRSRGHLAGAVALAAALAGCTDKEPIVLPIAGGALHVGLENVEQARAADRTSWAYDVRIDGQRQAHVTLQQQANGAVELVADRLSAAGDQYRLQYQPQFERFRFEWSVSGGRRSRFVEQQRPRGDGFDEPTPVARVDGPVAAPVAANTSLYTGRSLFADPVRDFGLPFVGLERDDIGIHRVVLATLQQLATQAPELNALYVDAYRASEFAEHKLPSTRVDTTARDGSTASVPMDVLFRKVSKPYHALGAVHGEAGYVVGAQPVEIALVPAIGVSPDGGVRTADLGSVRPADLDAPSGGGGGGGGHPGGGGGGGGIGPGGGGGGGIGPGGGGGGGIGPGGGGGGGIGPGGGGGGGIGPGGGGGGGIGPGGGGGGGIGPGGGGGGGNPGGGGGGGGGGGECCGGGGYGGGGGGDPSPTPTPTPEPDMSAPDDMAQCQSANTNWGETYCLRNDLNVANTVLVDVTIGSTKGSSECCKGSSPANGCAGGLRKLYSASQTFAACNGSGYNDYIYSVFGGVKSWASQTGVVDQSGCWANRVDDTSFAGKWVIQVGTYFKDTLEVQKTVGDMSDCQWSIIGGARNYCGTLGKPNASPVVQPGMLPISDTFFGDAGTNHDCEWLDWTPDTGPSGGFPPADAPPK